MNTVAIRPTLDSRTRLLALLELWTRVAETRWLAYLVFLAVYLPPTVILAENKLLWDDEFFTLYLSKAGSWSELVRAMSTGADQHPPSFYYLTHLVTSVLGPTNVTFDCSRSAVSRFCASASTRSPGVC